ncbi:Na/Pi cotransporter family protein [Salibacter halophilus]|uniref:Na/Pi cotransporter family protein n=1 Tax=Salibacter halophilus TaxID=1803916 RepID=A0A6N6M565_9FLAO|nr:Na/Pi cotransporter family protein [Salibacter halophilus]KAB1062853.1 Na/Pi cotransporter family protein [Salibacter halophilus]
MTFDLLNIVTALGALGLFVYGMKTMSEGIQRVAGPWIRHLLSDLTQSTAGGIANGFLTTVIVQSSSATTVMMVSFVNAGIMKLKQAINVIMGANIGTTSTAVLITLIGFSPFNVTIWGLPMLAIAFPLLFANSSTIRSLGEFFVGFGLFILGLVLIKANIPTINEFPEIAELIASVQINSFLLFLIFVTIGALFTVVIQSSSASLVITLTLAANGFIDFEQAAAMVLGENIGTTVTANLAANIGNVHAKRAARAHSIFNVFGVVWMLLAFPFFIDGIATFTNWVIGYSPLDVNPASEQYQYAVNWGVAFFHIAFNLANTFIFVWFTDIVVNLVVRLLPSQGKIDKEYTLEFIDRGPMGTPELSLLEAKKEMAKFGWLTEKMLNYFTELFNSKERKITDKRIRKLKKYENITDRIELEIADYLMKVSRGELTSQTSERVRSMLRISSELERIGDLFFQMTITMEKKIEDRIWFTPEQRSNIQEMLEMLREAFEVMNNNLKDDVTDENIARAKEIKRKIMQRKEEIRKSHFKSVELGDYNIHSGLVYNDLFNACEKITENVTNVTEAMYNKMAEQQAQSNSRT